MNYPTAKELMAQRAERPTSPRPKVWRNLDMHRLVEARAATGIPQSAVSLAIGLSLHSLGNIETGRSLPTVTVALRLAHFYGTTVEDLFGHLIGVEVHRKNGSQP